MDAVPVCEGKRGTRHLKRFSLSLLVDAHSRPVDCSSSSPGALIVHLPDGWTLIGVDPKRKKELTILYCSCHFSRSSSSRAVVRAQWIFGRQHDMSACR